MTHYLYCNKCKRKKKSNLKTRLECECGGVMVPIEKEKTKCANCGKMTYKGMFCSDACEDTYNEDSDDDGEY